MILRSATTLGGPLLHAPQRGKVRQSVLQLPRLIRRVNTLPWAAGQRPLHCVDEKELLPRCGFVCRKPEAMHINKCKGGLRSCSSATKQSPSALSERAGRALSARTICVAV